MALTWTTLTIRVCVLKSYLSSYCNLPRYSEFGLAEFSSSFRSSSSFSTRPSSSPGPPFSPFPPFLSPGRFLRKNRKRHQPICRCRNVVKKNFHHKVYIHEKSWFWVIRLYKVWFWWIGFRPERISGNDQVVLTIADGNLNVQKWTYWSFYLNPCYIFCSPHFLLCLFFHILRQN